LANGEVSDHYQSLEAIDKVHNSSYNNISLVIRHDTRRLEQHEPSR
jgi:hypothetical protein